MGTPPLELVILAIVAFLAGAVVTWLVNYASRGQDRQHHRPSTRPEGADPADERELLRVLRTKKGLPDILVQGRRYRRLREIADPQIGRETVEALKALIVFAEGLSPIAQSSLHPSPPREPAAASKPAMDEEAFLEQLRESNPFTAPKPSLVIPLPKQPRADSLPPLVPPADQINQLIQRRLSRQPDLVDQKIRLVTGPDGGLLIHVGLQTFHTVNDVTDPKARTLIQDAIREWESG